MIIILTRGYKVYNFFVWKVVIITEGPLITIIVAVYNGAKTLQRCLNSIINQTYQNIEIVIIDGGSKDGTLDIIRTNEYKISYWESKSDNGIYHAWNKALAHVNGEWIYFLGADDYFWNNEVLKNFREHLLNDVRDQKIVYGQVAVVSALNEVIQIYGEPWEKIKKSFRQDMLLPHQGVMHHRCIFEQYGNFDESFRISGDYDLLLRHLKNADAYFIPNLIIAGMQQGGVSSNPQFIKQANWELCRARWNNGLYFPSPNLTKRFMWIYCRPLVEWAVKVKARLS